MTYIASRLEDVGCTNENERIITARLFSIFFKMPVIHVFASTNGSEATNEDKECFYEQLQATLDTVPKRHDFVVEIDDLNPK